MSDYEKLFAATTKPTVIVIGEQDETDHQPSDKLQRRPSLYGLPQLFYDDDAQVQFFSLSVEKKAIPKVIPKPTRDSIANSLNIVAKAIRINDIKLLRPVPLTLVTVGVSIMRGAATEDDERQMICDLEVCQLKVSTYDKIQAFDLNLIIADYHYFIRGNARAASLSLQKASRLVPSNIQLYIETLEKAQELSEEAQDYETALSIENRLDRFDIAFDWKDRRALKRIQLQDKLRQSSDIF